MKKRILAIFLTASLLVGAMAASAMAAAFMVNGTAATEAGAAVALTVPQFSTSSVNVNFAGYADGSYTPTITVTSGASYVTVGTAPTITVQTYTGSGNFTITGESAGTAKITVAEGNLSAIITVTVTAAAKPVFTAPGSKLDIGTIWDSTNGGFYAGQEVTSADFSTDVGANAKVKWFEATYSNYTNAARTSLTGTISPTTSGLTFESVKVSGDQILHGYLTGTVKDVSSTTYTLTVKATDVAGTTESTYTFKVMPRPTITATTPSDIEWGKSWTFKPTATNAQLWEIAVSADKATSLLSSADYIISATSFDQSADIKFTTTNGQLSGTWKADRTKDGGLVGLSNWTSGTVATKKIILRAFNGTGDKRASAEREYTLKFIGVDPKIAQTNSNAFTGKTFTYGTNMPTSADTGAVTITAEGPGAISWDVTFPDGSGLSYDFESPADSYTSTLKIFGSPDLTMKNQTVTIKAYNPFSTAGVSITPSLTIGASDFKLAISGDTALISNDTRESLLTSGDKVVGGSFGTINLVALPGPVTWDTTNLPAGVTLTVDTTDEYGRKATLAGDFSAARSATTHAAKNYLIKATNSVLAKTDSISQDVMVYAEPVFDSEFLFNKKGTIDTDTKLEYTVPVSNFPTMTSWDISINGTQIMANSTPATGYESGWQPTVNSTYNSAITKTSFLSVDLASLTKTTPVLKLVGSLDVVPTDGGTFTIAITAKNPANTTGVTKEYTVKVNGTAPALKKEDITLSSSASSKAIAVTEGDAPIAMKAYIDAKTAKKLFGIEEDIDLSDTNISGIIFTQTTSGTDAYTGKGTFAYSTSNLPNTVNYGSVAYNKLPVTVEAENTDVSSKAASAKYTITISGTKPSWSTSNDLRGYNNTDLKAGATLGTAEELTTSANQALSSDSEYVLFKPAGSGPYDITVKPESKNGLSASVNDSGYIIITGTPTATKKDVSTKFSMTLKNPSTGDTAKTDLTVVAKPKPEAAGNIEKQLIIGKALKLAPKATVSNADMEWVIDTISGGATAVTNKEALKDTYGIDFDETKGTLSGTTKAATGKDTPLVITMHASSDIATSDPITATVTILGAKPKITAKKFSVAKDGTSTANITTNLSSETDTTKANVQFTGTFDDALAGLSGAINAPNTWQVTGTPAAVTKKQTVEVTMNNYGTEAKGKVSFTVVGSKPTVTGDTSVTVNAGESATASLTLQDTSVVSQKIKWKIATKPKGVSAKVKGDVNGATVTVKAGKKVANNTTATFTVIATDSISKTTSDPHQITVTVVNTNDTSAKAPETKAAAPEAEATEEIALGEGEVKLGVERTAGSLTAAQRRLIAEEGYVIAAVLPEIEEVTADGQYDFEVDIDEEVATGAELVWFAFSSKPTTDDEIVDFYDENYNDIFGVVPESHKVIVSPWLNAGTKYAPVIAVKADAAHAEATTLEGVKEAAEAKTE